MDAEKFKVAVVWLYWLENYQIIYVSEMIIPPSPSGPMQSKAPVLRHKVLSITMPWRSVMFPNKAAKS
jgi:hypothetical protein